MRIQHNISALNAHRQLGNNNSAVAKNLEKLSSGFRINRAGDDAAGLAISEKMRGQIRGLDMASRNANDGISLIQTAEGALNETHSILQRMRELAVQSSNGTYEEGVANSDRDQLQKETQALKDEIDRIASSTHFNNKKLLNGELGKAKVEAGAIVDGGKAVAGADGQTASKAQKAVYEYDLSSLTETTGATTYTIAGVALAATAGADADTDAAGASLVTAFNKSTDAKHVGFTASYDAATKKLTITADTAGKVLAGTDTAYKGGITAGATITGTLPGSATVKQVGLNEGDGSPATAATYNFELEFAKLKGGEQIKIGDHTITFEAAGSGVTSDGGVITDKNTNINIGDINDADAAKATAAKETLRQQLNLALDSVAEAVTLANGNAGANKFAAVTGNAALAVGSTANPTKMSFNVVATNAGAASNLGEIRFTDPTNSAFTVKTSAGKDAGAGKEAKFATATIKMDLSLLKAGDVLKFGDKELEILEAGKVANKNQIALDAVAATFETNFLDKLEEIGATGGGRASYNAITKELSITGTKAGQKASEFAASIPNVTMGTMDANGVAKFPEDGITFQIGANGAADQRVSLYVENQDTKTLGVDGVDISTDTGANAAIDLIDKATSMVSATRADLGALQNRLEHTISNLGTSVENLTAAESRIRDVDMAKEMMEMTKNNILTQAAQAMLAQANTQPQGVLQLLQ